MISSQLQLQSLHCFCHQNLLASDGVQSTDNKHYCSQPWLVFPVLIPSLAGASKCRVKVNQHPGAHHYPSIHPSILSMKRLVGGLMGACLLDGWMDGWWSPCFLMSEWMDDGWMISGQQTVLCWGSSFHGGLAHLLFYYLPFHPFT
jgi:hypothetical protein